MSSALADIEVIAALFASGSLLWAGIAKTQRPAETAIALTNFRLTKTPSLTAARAAASAEIATGILLAGATLAVDAGLWLATCLAAFMFAFFAVLVGTSIYRGESFTCMCFGSTDSNVSGRVFARAVVLMLISLTSFATSFVASASSVPEVDRVLLACSVVGALAIGALVARLPVVVHRVDPFAALSDQLLAPTGEASRE